jgi:hypothetical protein
MSKAEQKVVQYLDEAHAWRSGQTRPAHRRLQPRDTGPGVGYRGGPLRCERVAFVGHAHG